MFAWLWAMSLIWHYLDPDYGMTAGWTDLPVVLAAILVLVRPQNCYFLLTVAAAVMFDFLVTSPVSKNHWTTHFFIAATLCASFGMLALRRRSVDIASRDWLDAFRPVVCALILLLYLFASLHKLNSGFFAAGGSAEEIYFMILSGKHLSAFAHLFPTGDAFLAILPPLSVSIELLIPVLLYFRHTRLAAILIGILFHALLSLRVYPPDTDYPILLGAAYILFLPDCSMKIINASILDRLRRNRHYQPIMGIAVPAFLLAVIFVPLLYSVPDRVGVFWFKFANLKSAHWAAYIIIYVALLVFLLYKLRSKAFISRLLILRGARKPLFAIIALVIFVGMSPYLGLRTTAAFTMFSGLKTEGSQSNHFFMPLELQIFDYQKQVCVIETTAEEIPVTALTGELLTWFHFRELTRNNPDASITYTFEGQRFELERIADKPVLTARPDLFERFYLKMRKRSYGTATYCDGRW